MDLLGRREKLLFVVVLLVPLLTGSSAAQAGRLARRQAPAKRSAPPEPPPNYDGKWSALTDGNQRFNFNVEQGQITEIAGALLVKDNQCSYKVELKQNLHVPISNKTATLEAGTPAGVPPPVMTGTATFDTAQTAHGRMTVAAPGTRGRPRCAGTVAVVWAATRQAGSDFAALQRENPEEPVPPDRTYDGAWDGTTAQKEKLSFQVRDGAITRMYVSGRVAGGGCSSTNNAETTFNKPVPITDDMIVVAGGGGGFSYSVEGKFQAETSSSGTLNLYFVQTAYGAPPCEGSGETTWTAQKK